jgi:hypothetical protein
MKRYSRLLLIFFLLTFGGKAFSVKAEDAAPRAAIRIIHTEKFPLVRVLFDVYDAQGNFLSAMAAENLTLIEDGNALPAANLQENTPPLQLIVSINPSAPMAVRDKLGVSRYEKVSEALQNWANTLPADNADDMSLVSTVGTLVSHQGKEEWVQSLAGYHPDFQTAIPNIQSLAFALDLASDPRPQEGTKCAVLFITSHLPDRAALDTLATQTERAVQNGVQVSVWLIDSPTYFNHESANALRALATQTGGNFFAFSEEEPFPDLETDFSPLRHGYILEYRSAASSSGTHTLAIQGEYNGMTFVSEESSFDIEVEPPNPMLLSPPLQVTRQPPPDDPYNAENLLPFAQSLEMIVEFPDGHPRDLVRTALYVDGEKVAENTSPPFDVFTWDLHTYTSSGDHSLQVEAEDILGLSKTSLGVPVTITVVSPPTGIRAFLARNSAKITLGVILAAGILLIGTLLLGGRPILSMLREKRKQKERDRDPATQPVARASRTAKKRVALRKGIAAAHLEPMNRDGTPRKGSPISLSEAEISIGTDPVRASYILDDPSISPLHAKIRRSEDGRYLLMDAGSIAGTWLNFEPVGVEGRPLSHGDRIDFGQKTFRFVSPTSAPDPQPVIQNEGKPS